MAKQLSSNLKNLKFMQRSSQRQEQKAKEEEKASPDGGFGVATAGQIRKCIVIMEGDPHPGALRGRMSFQSFNPSIDKLNEETANIHQMQECINHQDGRISDRVDGSSGISAEDSNVASPDTELKRKQPEVEIDTPSPHKSHRNASGDGDDQSSSQGNRRGPFKLKQRKREKVDWNVLRPPKPHTQRSGAES